MKTGIKEASYRPLSPQEYTPEERPYPVNFTFSTMQTNRQVIGAAYEPVPEAVELILC